MPRRIPYAQKSIVETELKAVIGRLQEYPRIIREEMPGGAHSPKSLLRYNDMVLDAERDAKRAVVLSTALGHPQEAIDGLNELVAIYRDTPSPSELLLRLNARTGGDGKTALVERLRHGEVPV
jgi:hypothetical protein